ncbi:MAG TPA: bacillithiol biosynthesis cysteine-adding enzyme BshC [Gemmatimonadales bacterium]
MRIVTTPLAPSVPLPPLSRSGGVAESLLAALVAAPGVEAIRSRLRDPAVVVVTTGQQPGLFTGPLYTLYKALSASAIAQELEHRWGRPVVPVFWAAGDDHDYAEARWASWLDGHGELVTATLPDRAPDAPLTAMARLPLPAEVTGLIEQLEGAVPASPQREQTLAWLGRHYAPGRTLGAAYAGALAELFAPLGIACFDSTHPSAKAAMVPVLMEALGRAAELDRALADQASALAAAGRPITVPVGDGATLVFLEDGAGRDRLVLDQGSFVARRSGTRATLAQLETIAAAMPERLSPNVLLRPVTESALLPTVAYVAGPGELAYFAQCTPLYDRLGVPAQLPVPRWSGIIVEPRVDRVLEKFGATLADLLEPGTALEGRVIRSHLPAALIAAADRLRQAMDHEYHTILDGAIQIDPTLERPVGAALHHAQTGLSDIEKKIQAHLKKREATELSQIGRARSAVAPGGKPQERVLTGAAWLARYGPTLLDQVRAEAAGWYAGALAARAGAS